MIDRNEAIKELNDLSMYVEHAFTEEHKKSTIAAITKAIFDMKKLAEVEKELNILKEDSEGDPQHNEFCLGWNSVISDIEETLNNTLEKEEIEK